MRQIIPTDKTLTDLEGMKEDPAVAARMADFSAKIVASTPEELKTHVSAEIAKWEPVVKAANVQMD
jgi:tripartite-type tricarboxylate transporter receptor subunit TctC